jgi:predicted Mrr-cat superfamily restriction endonuclease
MPSRKPARQLFPTDVNAVWVVRAGKGDEFRDVFRRHSLIAVARGDIGDLADADEEEIISRVKQHVLPVEYGKIFQIAAMLRRVAIDMRVDDWVVTGASPGKLNVGVVRGLYEYKSTPELRDYQHTRAITWIGEVSRSDLPQEALKGLRAPQALYRPAAQSYWRAALTELVGAKDTARRG